MEKQDDFAMIKEIIRRRYTVKKIKLNENVQNIFKNSNLLLETSSNDKFIEAMPNLILIDGGKGQLNAALKALTERNLKIPTIALAKENEEIFLPNKYESLKLLKKNPVLQLLQTIRDEAHRFGLSYNRTLRKIQYTS
jgi:excinuclease ABC subunit C